MKIYILSILIVICLSCDNKTSIDYAILKGKITNVESNALELLHADEFFKYIITLNPDGSFADTLRVDNDRYELHDGDNKLMLYIGAGNELTINYDCLDLKNTLKVSGNGAEMIDYFNKKRALISKPREEKLVLFALEEDDFKQKVNQLKLDLIALVPNSPWISKAFQEKEKRSIYYNYVMNLKNYEFMHKLVTKESNFKASTELLKELDTISYNNGSDYLYSIDYRNLVSFYYGKKSQIIRKQDSLSKVEALFKTFETIENDTIKNLILYDYCRHMIFKEENLKTFYKLFMNISTNENHKKEITKIYNGLNDLSKGALSPEFSNYKDINGKSISLSDFRGKYVYIDVWATWCSPCKREIPFLQDIEKKYHDKNIEFVSISVDKPKDHNTWKRMVVDENLPGIQIIADNDFSSEFMQAYLIKSIPRFILIDPQGNIINSNAPRPSDKKLIEFFDTLDI